MRQFRAVPAGNPLHVNEDTTDMPSRRGTSRPRATPSPTPQLSGKRIDDRQHIDPSAGLNVLCQEPIAPGVQGQRNDQRSLELIPRILPNSMAAKCVSTVMGRIGGGAVRRSDRASLRGLLKTELAAQHGGTLIQNLNADDAAREDRLPGDFALVPVPWA